MFVALFVLFGLHHAICNSTDKYPEDNSKVILNVLKKNLRANNEDYLDKDAPFESNIIVPFGGRRRNSGPEAGNSDFEKQKGIITLPSKPPGNSLGSKNIDNLGSKNIGDKGELDKGVPKGFKTDRGANKNALLFGKSAVDVFRSNITFNDEKLGVNVSAAPVQGLTPKPQHKRPSRRHSHRALSKSKGAPVWGQGGARARAEGTGADSRGSAEGALDSGEHEGAVPDPHKLDMAHALGSHVFGMRVRGRLCQRSMMMPEGPKYDSKGAIYVPAHPTGAAAAQDYSTRAPRLLLPKCCNCCKKSVLGCE